MSLPARDTDIERAQAAQYRALLCERIIDLDTRIADVRERTNRGSIHHRSRPTELARAYRRDLAHTRATLGRLDALYPPARGTRRNR